MRHTAITLVLALAVASCSIEPPVAPDAVPVEPTQPAPNPTSPPVGGGGEDLPSRTAGGTFTGLAGHAASGAVTVRFSNGIATIELAENVRFSSVPDPWLYLNTTANANIGQPLRVSRLNNRGGSASYSFRISNAPDRYAYVLIWCDRYNVGVGAAPLAP